MKGFKGEVKARIVEARFALSGKIAGVQKAIGDTVKKWDLIASLDRKILQMELDKELADFEKVRADFESFAKKFPDPQDDNKFTKAEKQASLNASVKNVELAKAKLDQVNLFSPVDGVVIDDSGIVPGLFIAPAGNSIKIVDTSSYFFEVEIEQKDVADFLQPKKAEIKIDGIKESIKGDSKIVASDGKRFGVKIPIPSPSILMGMKGEVSFS